MSDCVGVRLRARADAPVDEEGAPLLSSTAAAHMLTEGVTFGAVQLPPGGSPVVLGPDRATTGGYPVIAHVVRTDLWLLGQLRPGAAVRLASLSFDDAIALWRSSGAGGTT